MPAPTRIGLNTFALCSPFSDKTLRWLEKIADWGYDFVEIAAEDPALINESRLRQALDSAGLACGPICGAFGPGRDLRGSPSEQQESLDYLKRLIDLAAAMDAGMVCGPCYSRVGRAEAYSSDERSRQFEQVATHLQSIAAYAEKASIEIAIEPLNRFETDFLNTSQQAMYLLVAIGSPALKVHLDTFHMNIEESDPVEAIQTAGSMLGHFHISSSHRGVPGDDRIEWERIANALQGVGYRGDLALETFNEEVVTIAEACRIWRPTYSSIEEFATRGLAFVKQAFAAKDTVLAP